MSGRRARQQRRLQVDYERLQAERDRLIAAGVPADQLVEPTPPRHVRPPRPPVERTWWNGEPAHAVRVRLVVDPPPDGLHPQYWAAQLVGTVRPAVRVTYGGRRFYLDNADGRGWAKVTTGHGSPHWPSVSLYGREVTAPGGRP